MTTGWGSDKPEWLRRLHVSAHHGYPAVGCRLCAEAREEPISLSRGLWQDVEQEPPDYEAIVRELEEASPADRIEAAMRYMRHILDAPEDPPMDGAEP